jgi:E3 ubiquitin-protein ligase SHPRH
MVSLIPRISSFAVSGTPARAHVSDLIHLLKQAAFPLRYMAIFLTSLPRFLRVDNIIGSTRLWNRLQKPGFAPYFARFFEHFGIR